MPDLHAKVTQAGQGEFALAHDENGAEYVIRAQVVARARDLRGPTGKPLLISDLVLETAVQLDVRRGGNVERIVKVDFPDGAADVAQQARSATREREREEARRQRELDEAAQAQRMAETAHVRGDFNPYTFLPFRRHRPDPGSRPRHRTAPPSASPPLHSGRIRLRLDLASPLATFGGEIRACATHEMKSDQQGGFRLASLERPQEGKHVEVSLLRDAARRPTLAGSSIKGTMRSWLEFITAGHRDISPAGVAWREPAINDDARVCGLLLLHRRAEDGTLYPFDDALTTVPMRGDARPSRLPSNVVAHILPLVFRGFKEPGEPNGSGERAVHRLRRFWAEWEPSGPEQPGPVLEHGMPLRRRGGGADVEHAILQVGVGAADRAVGVRVAALPRGCDLETLKSLDPTSRSDLIVVPRSALEAWFEAHRGGGAPVGKDVKVDVGDATLSVRRPDARTIRHATPVFYRLEGDRITYLSVIRGGRNAVTSIPPERYPAGLPAHADSRLDAARRIFGRVPGDGATGESGDRAWAGRVRIGAVRYVGDATTEWFTLRPLMSPKVQAAGFYLTGPSHVSWAPSKGGVLAGTKVYWHQPSVHVPGVETDLAARVRATAVEVAPDGSAARTTMNSTVEALLDGSFLVDVWFEDLDEQELSALLLAVSLRFRDGEAAGWRLGLAKPLGFGSVINVVEVVELLEGKGPRSLASRALTTEQLDERIEYARTHWFGDARAEVDVAAGIAALDSVRAEQFGYPRLGATRLDIDRQAYPRQRSAGEVLEESARGAQQHRRRGRPR
jgi:hypothetical protein